MTRRRRSTPHAILIRLLLGAAATAIAAPLSLAQPADPAAVTNAAADTEAAMKPYTDVISGPNVTFDMVPIPGGELLMGSPDDEADRRDDEGPQLRVRIEPFWMGRCEVTWDEYEVFMLKLDIDLRSRLGQEPTPQDADADAVSRPTLPYTDMTFDMGKAGYPAIAMTNLAARQYTKWLSMKTGRFYRLPTEAEWEYAARAGTTTAYSFGDDAGDLPEYGWFFDNAEDRYHPVGKLKPNAFGLHDMHGNVWEWCLDQYMPDRYEQLAGGDEPLGALAIVVWPTETYPRVVRGGSWYDYPEDLRSARRRGSDPLWKKQDPQEPKSIWYLTDATWVGFRVVRPLNAPPRDEWARYWEPVGERERAIMERQRGK